MPINTSSFAVPAGILAEALKKFKAVIPEPNQYYGRAFLHDNITLAHTADHKLSLHAIGDISLLAEVDVDESHDLASLVVSYSGLLSAVSAFKGERIRLHLADDLSLRGETSGVGLDCPATSSIDEYPVMPATDDVDPLVFPAAGLLAALEAVAPCMATDGSQYGTQQVYVGKRGAGGAELAATDGHRPGVYAFPEVVGRIPERSIPAKERTPEAIALEQYLPALNSGAVAWLLRHVERAGNIGIRFDKKHAEITGSEWTLQTQLCYSDYPAYREILKNIPDMPGRLVVKRADMIGVLRKARASAAESTGVVTLAAASNGEALTVYAKTGERSTFTVTVPAASRKFPGFSANRDFLLDIVTAMPRKSTEFHFAAGGNDFIYAREGDLTYLLTPMGEMVTRNLDYLAALAGPDQDYSGVLDAATPASGLPMRPPPFKAVVKRALADEDYRASLLRALGVLNPAV